MLVRPILGFLHRLFFTFFSVLLEKARFVEYNNKKLMKSFHPSYSGAHHTAEPKMDSCEIGFYCD